MINKNIFCLLILSLCGQFIVIAENSADTIIINTSNELLLIGKKVAFLEDKNSNLTISDIIEPKNQAKFIKQKTDVFIAPSSRAAYWFKFTVVNKSGEDIWFEAGGSYSAWYIDFFLSDTVGNYFLSEKSGASVGTKNQKYSSNFYWFKLINASEKQAKTFYVRIKSDVSYELPFYVGTKSSLIEKKSKISLFTYFFLGMMVIMILYNFSLFIIIKDKIYLSYVFFVFMGVLCYTFNNNFSLLGTNFLWWEKHISWQFLGDVSSVIFIIHFLNLRKNLPSAFFLYVFLVIVDFILAAANLFGVDTVSLIDVYMLISMLLVAVTIYTIVRLLLEKTKNAVIFTISWFFLLITIVGFMLVINGVFPYNLNTRYSMYFGIAAESLFFSMALADRFNVLKKEKEKVLNENIKLFQTHNQLLEDEVKKKTEDLAFKNKKLHVVLENTNNKNQQISKQNKELHKLYKYKEDMTGMIVHDLKNPLNIILNLAENELVAQAGKNMMNLIMNILDVYKNEEAQISLNKKHLFLKNLSKSAISEVSFLAKHKNISIELNINEEIKVNIDEEIIKRVFINILNNAIKFTPYNGKIFIEAEKTQTENKKIKISITDTGRGIPKDKIHLIFKKFGQAEQKSDHIRSYGIGLAFCKIAIEAHEGEIGVISEEGKGSTFWFTFLESEGSDILSNKEYKKQEENKLLNIDKQEKKHLKKMIIELSKIEFYEVGEILKTLNIFALEKHPNICNYIGKIKNAVFSGNLAEYEKLLCIE